MLVVTRKTGESLMIGDDVEVEVVALGRDFVRLGIRAPRDVPVHRHEVYLSLQKSENSEETPASEAPDPHAE